MVKSEILMFTAGIFLLISLPFLSGTGFYLWVGAKALYGIGLALMWTGN